MQYLLKITKIIWAILPFASFLFLLFLIFSFQENIEKKKEILLEEKKNTIAKVQPPVNVITLELQPSAIKDRMNLPGVIEPWEETKLSANIQGEIIEVLVKKGEQIIHDQILIRVDPAEYQIAVDTALAQYEQVQLDLARAKKLQGKKITTQSELDRLQTLLKTSYANLERADLQLSRCIIRSPVAGTIYKLEAKKGVLLMKGDPIAGIHQLNPLKAVIGIPESDIPAVRSINRIELTVQALNNKKIIAKKYYLASSPESYARLYRLELEIPNPDQMILPGMFIRGEIVKKISTQALSLPLYAIMSGNKEKFVYIEKDGKAVSRKVATGIIDSWQIEIIKGLEAGDRVVIEGQRNLEDGRAVKIVKTIKNPGSLLQ
jgi:membrane fusion protein, multidrug efflux system